MTGSSHLARALCYAAVLSAPHLAEAQQPAIQVEVLDTRILGERPASRAP